MRNDRHDEPLSDEELELFLQYLHRFAKHDVDQFVLMEVGDPDYPCYLDLSRAPAPGADPAVYRRP
ncbi:hypothetical protein ACWDR2_33410 [Streptomyces sp. NPDC003631]|uniref:hypothetical protein n=1 Tax=unclassified Streptomyces TaxID=2593676 RepID=UPI000740D89F|nr:MULTISPECIES: hypothetical protein [unclassified Streptomyces]KUJ36304.1 hypothetical protein ADL25_31925 [Streptomyces sp. NRRL F-5122]MDX3262231.1 hypothetical protein [Streptomyces sp. MI02-2A]MEE1671573.1 hypothetical protein [Streptomyces sp. WAC07094]